MLSLKQRVISGTIWTVVSYGLSQALRFGSNLILTRLLVPEMFGLMALVNSLIMGLSLFSDIGINASIVQNKRGNEPNFLNTAWTIQVLRGFGLWIFCFLIAWPFTQFYQDSRLLWLIPVVGFSTVIQGFNSTYLATLNRNIEIKKLMRFELTNQIILITTIIIWAYFSPTIWALVGGNLVHSFIRMLWSHRLKPDQSNHFAWDKESLQELMNFGKWIFISTALTFLANQTDRLILGKLLSFEMLGVYVIAITFAEIPKNIMLQIGRRLIFPIISQQTVLSRSQLREKIRQPRWWLLLGSSLIIVILFSCGDFLILHLYDQRYKEAAWMTPILALGFWPFLLTQIGSASLLAIGKPYYSALGNFFKVFLMAIGIPLSFWKMGMTGAIIVIACNDFPFYAGVMYGLQREKLSFFKQDLQATGVLIALLSLAILVRAMLGLGSPISI